MSRLPEPGKDVGTWGIILNDFLNQSHNADGSIKDNAVTVDLSGKVDKITGKSLILDTDITRLDGTSGANTGDQDLSGKVDINTAIAGATKTKISYDAKGLVITGADATTEDIASITDKRYSTDAQLAAIEANTAQLADIPNQSYITEKAKTSDVNNAFANITNYVYRDGVGLRRWRAKLSGLKSSGAGILNINIVGNSLVEGTEVTGYTTNNFTKTFVGLMRSALATKYGDVGFGFIPPYFPSSPATSLTVFTGTWTNQILCGIHSSSKETTVVGSYVTITFYGTGADLFYGNAQNLNSKISVSIDGGTATELSLFYGLGDDKFLNVADGLADGQHTVKITKIEDTVPFRYFGILAKKGTTGVRVNMMGRSSYDTTGMVSSPNLQVTQTITKWAPALTILAHFCNDQDHQIPLATYSANLQLMITRALMYGSVLLIPLGVWQSPRAGITEAEYFATMKALATTNNCAMLDMYNYLGASGNYSTTTLATQNSAVHLNNLGHQLVASEILNLID